MKKDRILQILNKAVLILEDETMYHRCICDMIRRFKDALLISYTEYLEFRTILAENKPTPDNEYKEFTQNEYWMNKDLPIEQSFWWKPIFEAPETRQIRINYLKALINNLK